jgi:hypothetical protein
MAQSSWGVAIFSTPTSPHTSTKPVVLTTDTFEGQRRKINQISENVGDIGQLQGNFTNLTDAVNSFTAGVSEDEVIALTIALG